MTASWLETLRQPQAHEAAASVHLQLICAGLLAAVVWSGLAIQFAVSISSAISEHSSILGHLADQFSFFTVQTNLLIALSLTLTVLRLRAVSSRLGVSVQSALVTYIVIVGVVFNVLLQPNSQGIQIAADRILHIAVPVFYISYWWAFTPKGRLSLKDPVLWLIYPFFYVAYTLVRGAMSGIYPYPFIDVSVLGYSSVCINLVFFTAAFFSLGLIVMATDYAVGRSGRRRRLG